MRARYFLKSCATFHRILLPISNSTRSFPYPVQRNTPFFTRPCVYSQDDGKKRLHTSVPPKFSPISCLSISVAETTTSSASRSFATRRRTNGGSHEFRRETTEIGVEVEALHIGRRFPTLRQYDQMPPVILRLFAPRRVAALYVEYVHICRRRVEYRDGTRRKCSEGPRGIPVRIAHGFRVPKIHRQIRRS